MEKYGGGRSPMSMPRFPEDLCRPTLPEAIVDIIRSISLEEIALAHLINAEAEKVQAFVGKCSDFPTNPTNKEIVTFNQTVGQLMDTILMKEWLLLKKLETVIRMEEKREMEEMEEIEEGE
jgi:hypothetical protein